MYNKKILLALIAFFLYQNVVYGKKTKKNKRTKSELEDTTLQPNVISYSTFGFNDVGSYDGFVPSSPDYVNHLSSFNTESTTRLYAPAFPTALDSTGDINYSQSQDSQVYNTADDGGLETNIVQNQQNSMIFYNTPSFENVDQSQRLASEQIYQHNIDTAPVYGTKLNSKIKNIPQNEFNNTEFNVYSSSLHPTDTKYLNFQSTQNDKFASDDDTSSNYNSGNRYFSSYPTTNVEDSVNPVATKPLDSLKFPRVIDFTKVKQYYPTHLVTVAPLKKYVSNNHDESKFNIDNYDDNKNKFRNSANTFINTFDTKVSEDNMEKQRFKSNSFVNQDFTQNYIDYYSSHNNILKNTKINSDYKDKIKSKPWESGNYSKVYNKEKNPLKDLKDSYSTNFSNMNFKSDFGATKKPLSSYDELVPASSNIVDQTDYYHSPYATFKKMPNVKSYYDENEEYYNDQYSQNFKNKYKSDDNMNKYKGFSSTVPSVTTNWGNAFNTDEFSYKHYKKNPQYIKDEINDDIVHIPKRPHNQRYSYVKHYDSKPNDWASYSRIRHNKPNNHLNDWNHEFPDTRFKSEEDLLGLRTRDTSHPSYLPTFKPVNEHSEENDYKRLVEKWRQSYLRAKYKNTSAPDYESYASETKPVHVPVPNPYPIEVPHPVIVPVPRPYPVRVPIPKPVAVPIVHQLNVPVEKPVPYPVVKEVPYPIEKPVPVPVEKEVPFHVVKPYPVPIPQVRPVFHHTRPQDEEELDLDPDDYRPEATDPKGIRRPYVKRPRSTHPYNKSRRPSYAYYQERNRRRWPSRRPAGFSKETRETGSEYHKRPSSVSSIDFPNSSPYNQRDYEFEYRDSNGNRRSCKSSWQC